MNKKTVHGFENGSWIKKILNFKKLHEFEKWFTKLKKNVHEPFYKIWTFFKIMNHFQNLNILKIWILLKSWTIFKIWIFFQNHENFENLEKHNKKKTKTET